METSINIREIESYSMDFSKKICDEFFSENNKISGNEILELCEIRQINLLVLKNLFEEWRDTSENLISPYFNYENEEVRELYKKYANALSRNILIDRDHFEPLLSISVKEAFLLIFSPFEFYAQFINSEKRNKISLSDLKTLKKYIKINGHLLDDLIKIVENDTRESIFIDEIYELFNEVCESTKEDPEDITKYIDMFSKVIPLKAEQVYLESSGTDTTEKTDLKKTESESQTINEKFHQEKSPLVEKFVISKNTLADKHEQMPIESIKRSISINQKFLFVKELFNGDDDEFLAFISELDNCLDLKEADQMINTRYHETGKWNEESDTVQQFRQIVNKRFRS